MTTKAKSKSKARPAPKAPKKKKEQVCIKCKVSSCMEVLHVTKYPDRKITRYRCACGQVQIRNVAVEKKVNGKNT